MKKNHLQPPLVLVAGFLLLPLLNFCGRKPEKEQEMGAKTAEPRPSVKMKVITIPASSDILEIRVLFNSGSVDDPKGKEGLSYITAKMIAEGGTKRHKYSELLDLFYPMATGIGISVDKEMTVFTGRVHKDHISRYLPLLFEVLLEPAFTDEDFERIKDETLNYIKKTLRQADDELLSKEALDIWIYHNHPYGHLVEGTVSGVESITVEDVKDHYRQIFTQDRLTIGLAGAVTEDIKRQFTEKLSALPVSGKEKVKIPEPEEIKGRVVKIIQKQTSSTAITMGAPVDVKRGDPDFYPLMLAFSCLGEHRQSMGRLFKFIREARGLNYGDYAYIEHFIQEGSTTKPMVNVARSRQEMSIWLRPVQPQHGVFALRLALYQLERFASGGLTEEEFDRTRGFLNGYTRVIEESLMRRLGYALDDLFYSIPPFLKGAREAFASMTVEDVTGAIKRHISFDNLKIIVVTADAELFKGQLIGKAPLSVSYDTPKPHEIIEEDKKVLKMDLKIAPENIQIVSVDSLFQ